MSEETGCDGPTALVKSGFTADAAIVGEPTRCEVVTAHKRLLWLEIETHGRSCHASLPQLCRQANGQSDPRGANHFADTGPFSEAGITAVLFGPGDIAQAHTADEFVELAQVYQATEIILTLLTSHAGQSIIEG